MVGIETLAALVPTTLGGVVGLLVQLVIIWAVVMLADKIIAHNAEPKRALILAVLAYFISPLVLAFAAVSIPFASIIIPLIVWVVLGEILLRRAQPKQRLKVAAIAFIIYLVLSFIGVPLLLSNALKI